MGKSKEQREAMKLLRKKGAELLRKKKHPVYALPSGKRLVAPGTSSDHRAWKNFLAEIRRAV